MLTSDSERMHRELEAKLAGNSTYQKMQRARERLPAYEMQVLP
jgi:hypothetical protein